MIKKKKKIPPPVQPRMKKGGIENLQEYNKDFKRWQMRLRGWVLNNKETIKTYIFGLDSRIIAIFMSEGYSYKNFKTLTRWQLAVEIAIAKYDKYRVRQESTAEKTKSVRLPLKKLKELVVRNQMKKLTRQERKQIIK
jgi:hypothetical protein